MCKFLGGEASNEARTSLGEGPEKRAEGLENIVVISISFSLFLGVSAYAFLKFWTVKNTRSAEVLVAVV